LGTKLAIFNYSFEHIKELTTISTHYNYYIKTPYE